MKPPDKREKDRLKTRAAILDATEALMREEGYAAVTSRRVAERAGLKSQLVHYHFRSMDELFQEAYRRSDRTHFSEHLSALSSEEPLKAIWATSKSTADMEVVSEYLAAAHHHKILQQELTQSWGRFRMLHRALIEKYLQENQIDSGNFTPDVLAFLLSAIRKSLIEEARLGFFEGHAEIIAFVDALVGSFARPRPRSQKRGKPAMTAADQAR